MAHDKVTCPKCGGSGRRPVPEDVRRWIPNIAGYDAATDTLPCDNCGGQTMSCRGTGLVRVDPATGKGCLHDYVGRKAGNCYHVYSCRKCGDSFDIDSGD